MTYLKLFLANLEACCTGYKLLNNLHVATHMQHVASASTPPDGYVGPFRRTHFACSWQQKAEVQGVCRVGDGAAQPESLRARRRRTRGVLHLRNMTAVLIFVLILIVLSMFYLRGLRSVQVAAPDGSGSHENHVNDLGRNEPHASQRTPPGNLGLTGRQDEGLGKDGRQGSPRDRNGLGHQPPG
jgi:hypothetical protein